MLKGKKRQVRVFINPEQIIAGTIAEDNKEFNNLQGRVVQVSAENGLIRVVIEAGILIAILMPPEKYNQTRPMIGESINISIPPTAVKVF